MTIKCIHATLDLIHVQTYAAPISTTGEP